MTGVGVNGQGWFSEIAIGAWIESSASLIHRTLDFLTVATVEQNTGLSSPPLMMNSTLLRMKRDTASTTRMEHPGSTIAQTATTRSSLRNGHTTVKAKNLLRPSLTSD